MPNPLRAEAVVFIPSVSVPEVHAIERIASSQSQRLTSSRRRPSCQTHVKDTPSESIGLIHPVNTLAARVGKRRAAPNGFATELSPSYEHGSSKEKHSNSKKGNRGHRRGEQKIQQTCRCNRPELEIKDNYIGTATNGTYCNLSSSVNVENPINVGNNQECRNDVFNNSIRACRSMPCGVCGFNVKIINSVGMRPTSIGRGREHTEIKKDGELHVSGTVRESFDSTVHNNIYCNTPTKMHNKNPQEKGSKGNRISGGNRSKDVRALVTGSNPANRTVFPNRNSDKFGNPRSVADIFPIEVVVGQRNEDIENFPCLPRTTNVVRSNTTTECAELKPPSLTYLAFASKCIKDDTPIESSLNCDRSDSSWFYMNVDQKNVVCQSTLASVPVAVGDDRILSTSEGSVELQQQETTDERINLAHQSVVGTQVVEGTRDVTMGRAAFVNSCSKSTADRWRGRWLEIARQQSARLKERQQRELSKPSPLETKKSSSEWHDALSHGAEKSSPYSYMYLNDVPLETAKPSAIMEIANMPSDSSIRSPRVEKNLKQQLYSPFRWWTAVHAGDHNLALQMMREDKIKPDECFCFTTYMSDCQSIVTSENLGSESLAASATLDASSLEVAKKYLKMRSGGNSRTVEDSDSLYSEEYHGLNAIHVCAKLCHPVLLDHLLRSTSSDGANSRDRNHKQTALHLACHACHLECVKILLLHGADAECRDKQGDTVLHRACSATCAPSLQIALVAFLCDRSKSNSSANGGSLKVNTKNKKRETALMLSRTRDLAVILIGAGADPLCVSSDGLDAASMAARRGDSKVLEAILGCNSFRQAPVSMMSSACTSASKHKTTEIAVTSVFTTPLHEAARMGNANCIRVMLSARYCSAADLNCTDRPTDCTALMLACTAGHMKVAQMLLDDGADAEIEDRRGVTAVVLAARYGHLPCLRAVITARSASLLRKNNVGETVLEMLSRVLRQDILSNTSSLHTSSSSASSSASDYMACPDMDMCLKCVAELIMSGSPVTERFVKRLSSSNTISLMKAMKVLKTSNPLHTPLHPHRGVSPVSASAITFEVEACAPMETITAPNTAFCDIAFLLADDERCMAHSFVISSSSAALRAMLQSEMLTQIEVEDIGMVVAVALPHCSKGTFLLMLEWMYTLRDVPGNLDLSFSDDQAALLDLLYLSNELLVIPLQRLCEGAIGRNLDCFDKDSVLSLGLSLDLHLLLTFYWNRYPISSKQFGSELDYTPECQFYFDWGLASCSSLDRIENPEAHSAHRVEKTLDYYGQFLDRREILGNRSIKEFTLKATDRDWCRWLAASSIALNGTFSGCKIDSRGSSCSRRLKVDTVYSEDSLASWWFESAISGMVIPQNKSAQLGVTHTGARSYFSKCCCSQGSDSVIRSEKVPDRFDYTCSLKAPPLNSATDLDTSLIDSDPNERMWAVLTNGRKCIVSVNLLFDADHQTCVPLDEGESTDSSMLAESSLDQLRSSLLIHEPFLALRGIGNYPLNPVDTADIESLSRLQDITPPCVLFQQKRIALLRYPDSSLYDVIIVLTSPSAYNESRTEAVTKCGQWKDIWDTSGNRRYIPIASRYEEQEDAILLVIPVHRAMLSAGSGKLDAMIHYAMAQEDQDCVGSGPIYKRSVLTVEVVLEDREDSCEDFKDLIWYIYTGVLREKDTYVSTHSRSDTISDTGISMAVSNTEVDNENKAAWLLRMLWLADEYLVPGLSSLLEKRLMISLSPLTAPSFLMGAQAMGLERLRLAAGLCVLYSVGSSMNSNISKPEPLGAVEEREREAGATDSNSQNIMDSKDENYESTTAHILIDILHTLAFTSQ